MYRFLAGVLGCSTVAIAAFCPLFLRTRKGIVFVHFCLVQTTHLLLSSDERIVGTGWTNVLLSSAAVCIFVEHILTLNRECREIELPETLSVISLIGVFDLTSVLFFKNAPMWSRYSHLLAFTVSMYIYAVSDRKPIREQSLDELACIEHDSLFFDFKKHLNVLGRGSFFKIFQIGGRLIVGLMPTFGSLLWVRYTFLLTDFTAILTLCASPPIVGGTVQCVKLTGRWIVSQQFKSRVLEAMRKYQRRGGKEPNPEMLLANVEEQYNEEVGFVTTELV